MNFEERTKENQSVEKIIIHNHFLEQVEIQADA